MKLRLVTKNLASQSCKALAQELSKRLGYKVFRGHFPKPKRENLFYGDCKDKIYQYKWFEEQKIPALEYTLCSKTAQEWVNLGNTVFARTLTRASQGKGIIILEEGKHISAPVYTKYKKKKKEFRILVFKEQVVHVLEKRKRKGFEGERESKIRNLANGYVYCSDYVVEPEGLRELALKAARVTMSDFKGVDIGWNEKKQELFVIEVNSAPGIQGTNIQRFCDLITKGLK